MNSDTAAVFSPTVAVRFNCRGTAVFGIVAAAADGCQFVFGKFFD